MFGSLSRTFLCWRRDAEVGCAERLSQSIRAAQMQSFFHKKPAAGLPRVCRADVKRTCAFIVKVLLRLQLRCAKRLAFERKQRALRDAVQMGDRLARKKRRHTLGACLNAWRLTAAKFQAVGAALQRRSQATLEGAMSYWQQVVQRKVRQW